MPLIPDKKKVQTVFKSRMDEDGKDGIESDFELRAVAESMMDAFKEGSVEKLVSALEAFIELDEEKDDEEHEEMMKGY